MWKAFVWVEEQHTLGFLYSKITVEYRFYIDLISMFRPKWAFIYKLSKIIYI